MLSGPAVRLGRAPVQTQHELQVLVGFLLVRQRPVVLLLMLVSVTAALQRGATSGQFPVGHYWGPQQ